jgi:hypothetical protein
VKYKNLSTNTRERAGLGKLGKFPLDDRLVHRTGN